MNRTIIASCGDVIPVAQIDAIGEVLESFFEEPIYKKFFKWQFYWSSKTVSIGYEFIFHTSGGSYYWINRDTKEQAEHERQVLIDGLNGHTDTRQAPRRLSWV
jgi:hypothetical protein